VEAVGSLVFRSKALDSERSKHDSCDLDNGVENRCPEAALALLLALIAALAVRLGGLLGELLSVLLVVGLLFIHKICC